MARHDWDLAEHVKEHHDIDLGNGYYLKYFQWAPDRKLNPQYVGIPDVPRCGAHIVCPHGDVGGIMFVIPGHPIFRTREKGWTVESWEPLTVSPSIQFMDYKDGRHVPGCCHGFIREGRWVSA